MKYRLSICIPTLNRGTYIGETLESIVSQWEEGVEMVIVDGGSTDDTEQVVRSYQKRFPDIRYVKLDSSEKKPSNEGFDRDCDHAVVLASGEYCWLMTDDDLLKPGALTKVLLEMEKDHAIIVANSEVTNSDFTEILVRKRPDILQDQIFESSDWDGFVSMVGSHLTFVGAVVIKRSLWLSRNREKYYGSGFIHVGVIFDKQIGGTMLVTASPLVSIRFGNAQWTSRAFQIWLINWPSLVWSFSGIADSVKVGISPREPWKQFKTLLFNRAMGVYSMREYRLYIDGRKGGTARKFLSRVIAMVPRTLLYFPVWIYIYTSYPNRALILYNLAESWKKN